MAIEMIVAQGGIVGWATPFAALEGAVTKELAHADMQQGRWAGR